MAKMNIPAKMLKWRRKQARGKIMKPSTFKSIEKSAEAAGATNPKAVAGKAYWRTAKAKYSASKK
jgi:hypothetical protein